MSNIEEFIRAMSDRQLMYIDKKRIDYIFYIITGFFCGNGGNEEKINTAFRCNFSNWTLNWVKKNVDANYEFRYCFWYHIYEDVTDNDEDAVKLFFKLSREFFMEYHANEKNNI